MPRTAASDAMAKRVGLAIRRARAERGLTQAELAAKLNVGNPSYIANVEAGRMNLTVGQLANVAEALGAGLQIELPLLDTAPLATSVMPSA